MALRCVSRRFAIPALRRASGPRLSAAFGPPASRFSQAGYSNGGAGRKQREETAKLLAEYASAEAAEAALRHAERLNKLERRLNIVSPVIGIGLAGYIIYIIERDYAWVFERRAINRESMELVGVDMDDADMDEADMEGDQMA